MPKSSLSNEFSRLGGSVVFWAALDYPLPTLGKIKGKLLIYYGESFLEILFVVGSV